MAEARGISFPFRASSKEFPVSVSGQFITRDSVLQILLCSLGERVMRPDYGSRLIEMISENINPGLVAAIQAEILRALGVWDSRVQVDDIQIELEQSGLEKLLIVSLFVQARGRSFELVLDFPIES